MTRSTQPSSWRPLARHKSSSASDTPISLVSGLVILHGRPDDRRDGIVADIVTIHGLNGHYMKTWTTESDVCWPRDLLPRVTSVTGPTRIMTFGYAAGQLGTKLDLDIEDAAWQLIHGLEKVRADPEIRDTKKQRNRPLIFIVHSLGGLVLKKALIISNNALSLRHILWSVEGIVFLATPHRGSALADVADRILRFASVTGSPQRFVKALKMRSPELAVIAEEFRQIVNQRKLPIASFYELYAFKAIPCLNAVVVTRDSAVLHISSEKLFGAERDHRSIARYEDEHDEVFQQVVTCLTDFMKKGIVSSNARVFIPWDSSGHFKGRRETMQQLYSTFFPQLDENTEGAVEDHSARRVVMLHGDGGLGKTELTLKFARENEFRYDYIFLAESTNLQILRGEVLNLHDSLGLPQSSGRELQDLREFLRQEQSWLFILDNDNDFLALNYFKFPDVNHGHILMTCRSRENTTDPRIHQAIHVGPLNVQEARDLIYSRAGISIADRAQLEEVVTSLVETLGCIPAMVENTAAYMVSFEASVQDCLRLMNHRKSRRSILGYHAVSARYKVSAESLFRIRIDSLQKYQPRAYLLLSALVWLDRTKTTNEFFTRAVERRRRWAANGETELRGPELSFVPDEFIELINSPEFEIAMTSLKHSSLIARDEVFDHAAGTKGSIVLHPSLVQFLRDLTAHEDIVKAICPALTLVAHAHPVLEGGLEKSITLQRQMRSQIQQCLLNIEELGAEHSDLLKAFHGFWGLRGSAFCDAAAEILLEAISSYRDDDETDIKLIKLIEALLKDSRSIFLRARLWSKRLPLEYYKVGRLYEGCAAADRFMNSLRSDEDRQAWTSRDNAEIGILRALTVEYRPNEPGLTPAERWKNRADYIDEWKPLDPESPSTLESYVVGLGVRMRAKLAKDFGQFVEAYYGTKEYCELHAERGSREEGWALGDLGQLVLELEGSEHGPEIAADLAKHGTNFGEKVSMTEGMRLCDLVAYFLSRAVNSRMFERGYFTAEARLNARESDTMWLELIHAMTLVHQGQHAPERLVMAERELQGLSERFRRIEAVESWYDEQIRHFAIKCSLAQVAHLQHHWEEARDRWAEAIRYGQEAVGEWRGDHYYIEVAKISQADAQCSGGVDPRVVLPALEGALKRVGGKRVMWMLGMGTFWLDFVMERLVPRIQALARLDKAKGQAEVNIAVLGVVVQEL